MRGNIVSGVLVASAVACGGSTSHGVVDAGSGGSGGAAFGGASSGGAPAGGGVPSGGGLPGGGGAPAGGGQGGTPSCIAPPPGSLSGDFLLAVSATVAPTKPILFHAIVGTPPGPAGQTELVLSVEPLDAHDRITPVGPMTALGPTPIGPDGGVTIAITAYTIPGAANPITVGADIQLDATLVGHICAGADFDCGDLFGQVSKPITLDLDGSTWTLERYLAPGTPPSTVFVDCQKTQASPPPS